MHVIFTVLGDWGWGEGRWEGVEGGNDGEKGVIFITVHTQTHTKNHHHEYLNGSEGWRDAVHNQDGSKYLFCTWCDTVILLTLCNQDVKALECVIKSVNSIVCVCVFLPSLVNQIPVACKSCPCGYIFISRKLLREPPAIGNTFILLNEYSNNNNNNQALVHHNTTLLFHSSFLNLFIHFTLSCVL